MESARAEVAASPRVVKIVLSWGDKVSGEGNVSGKF